MTCTPYRLSQPLTAAFHAAVLLLSVSGAAPALAQFAVQSTTPTQNALNITRTPPLSVTFDRTVNPTTFTAQSFWAFGRFSGPVTGALSLSNANRTVTLTPSRPFFAGEVVTLIMSHDLRGMDGTALRPGGYTLMFTIRAAPSNGVYTPIATLTDRDATGAQTRIYGGLACDLNRDGWCDMTMVNEVSADLRVFLNRADGSGLFRPMTTPYTPIPYESSPNRPADFNRDGFTDIITSSDGDDAIAIAYGNGLGGFSSTAIIDGNGSPRGIGILDLDGDGDLDAIVTNQDTNTLSVLTNDGTGHFPTTPPTINAIGSRPYGMVAADMNNDGLLDLVTGFYNDQTIATFLNNGNGTFTRQTPRPSGGRNWVLQVGDLNGDGKLDVVTANSTSNTGAVLMGNGNGTFASTAVYNTTAHSPSTDLADIDGDGDLDWIVSVFGGGRWYLYRNNGAGVMTLSQTFIADSNPSCTIFADYDNDGDVDLMLLDEIADTIRIMRNGPACGTADFNGDGDIGTDQDIEAFFRCLAGTCCPTCGTADFNGDGDIGTDQDIEAFFRVLSGNPC